MASSNKSVAFWLVTGCGLMAAAGIAFFAFIFAIVFTSMRSSTPYKDALRIASADPRVQAVTGTPAKPGLIVTGSIKTNNGAGNADLSFTLSGPKGAGSVHVVGTKTGGRWSYSTLTFTPRNGTPIDLQAPLRTATPGG